MIAIPEKEKKMNEKWEIVSLIIFFIYLCILGGLVKRIVDKKWGNKNV